MLLVMFGVSFFAFAIAYVITALMIRLAPSLGLVDRPAARKTHTRPTPLGGGIAIFLGVSITLALVVGAAWLLVYWPSLLSYLPEIVGLHVGGVLSKAPLVGLLIAAGLVQTGLGLADDWRPGGLDYRLRLFVEFALVGGLCLVGIRITAAGDSWWFTIPLTCIWTVGLINSMNFLDNMDGLSSGVGMIACSMFATVMGLMGELFIAGMFLVLASATAGFWLWNWNPARIFMGDAGSNFLGFWIGTTTVMATFHTENFHPLTLLAPLCVLAVPLYDTTSVILLRLWQGRSPFLPDKQHFSHRLVRLGFTTKQAVGLIYLITFTTGLSGILLYFVPPAAAMLVVAQVVALMGILAIMESGTLAALATK